MSQSLIEYFYSNRPIGQKPLQPIYIYLMSAVTPLHFQQPYYVPSVLSAYYGLFLSN